MKPRFHQRFLGRRPRRAAGRACRPRADRRGPSAHAADLERRITELTTLRDDVRRLRDRAATLDAGRCSAVAACQVIPIDE
jgi:hypothetical protein